MSRTYSQLLWKFKTSQYHKNKARKRLRYYEKHSKNELPSNYSGFTKKLYPSWDICDFKKGIHNPKIKSSVIRRGKRNVILNK